MIKLSESLSTYVRRELKINDETRTSFTEEELASVSYASISRDDMDVIKYFKHLSVLDLNHYPSLTSEDIKKIGETIPTIISLKIKEQNSLYRIDLSSFKNLLELAIIHNDNLIQVENIPEKVKRFTFYDNREYKNVQQLVYYIESSENLRATIDFIYYVGIKRNLIDNNIFNSISWVESQGLRFFSVHEYTKTEIDFVMECISNVVSKYIYVNDTPLEKFSVLYKWMIENVDFINEDEKGSNYVAPNNTYKVFNTRTGGRLSYAKAFQMLLSYAELESTAVYSYGALDSIGYYNGNKVFSLFGTSDYSLIRIKIDNKSYYCDIAWDSIVDDYKYADALRLFLVSKDELGLRHKFVGEGNVINSYSYHGDDSDDLVMFATYRIDEVDKLFGDIEKLEGLILAVDVEKAILKNIIDTKEINEAFKFAQEKEGLLLTLDSEDEKKNELLKRKSILIKNNAKVLKENYIEGDNVKEYLKEKKDGFMISKSLYSILSNL